MTTTSADRIRRWRPSGYGSDPTVPAGRDHCRPPGLDGARRAGSSITAASTGPSHWPIGDSAGEPLQYVLGRWPFRSLELRVDPRVLIPEAETEQVVEVALDELARRATQVPMTGPDRRSSHRLCVDLGTGSGAIALSLATEGGLAAPGLEVWATDVSADALDVAARTSMTWPSPTRPRPSGCAMVEGSWFDALPSSWRPDRPGGVQPSLRG
jgi:hypothetical protein